MIALDILKQIETELNIKLEKSDGIAYFSKAYTLDKEGQCPVERGLYPRRHRSGYNPFPTVGFVTRNIEMIRILYKS